MFMFYKVLFFSRQVNILHLGYGLTLANSADNEHF